MKKENKKPKSSKSRIIYLIELPYLHSKVAELQKISYDITIWLNSVLWRHNP